MGLHKRDREGTLAFFERSVIGKERRIGMNIGTECNEKEGNWKRERGRERRERGRAFGQLGIYAITRGEGIQ